MLKLWGKTDSENEHPCYPNPAKKAKEFTSVRFGGSSPLAPILPLSTRGIRKKTASDSTDRQLRTARITVERTSV